MRANLRLAVSRTTWTYTYIFVLPFPEYMELLLGLLAAETDLSAQDLEKGRRGSAPSLSSMTCWIRKSMGKFRMLTFSNLYTK